jgi:hypothetical protein
MCKIIIQVKSALLPRAKSSKERQEKEWRAELSVPLLWQVVPVSLSKSGLPPRDERAGIKNAGA